MTHTSGDWSIHRLSMREAKAVPEEKGGWSYRQVYIGSGPKIVAEALMWTAPDGGYPRVDNVEEQDSNARLIAAAPELLAALKAMMAYYDTPSGPADLLARSEAAIAKAEGATEPTDWFPGTVGTHYAGVKIEP